MEFVGQYNEAWQTLKNSVLAQQTNNTEVKLALQTKPCEWSYDADGYWNTSCGGTWVFTDGTPEENEILYCHKCGNPIEINLKALEND
jgi:hypothetical protein